MRKYFFVSRSYHSFLGHRYSQSLDTSYKNVILYTCDQKCSKQVVFCHLVASPMSSNVPSVVKISNFLTDFALILHQKLSGGRTIPKLYKLNRNQTVKYIIISINIIMISNTMIQYAKLLRYKLCTTIQSV